ncbi:MAG TPA: hypothetical protein ACYCC8_00715 [Candidatus Azoamicus sp.]
MLCLISDEYEVLELNMYGAFINKELFFTSTIDLSNNLIDLLSI